MYFFLPKWDQQILIQGVRLSPFGKGELLAAILGVRYFKHDYPEPTCYLNLLVLYAQIAQNLKIAQKSIQCITNTFRKTHLQEGKSFVSSISLQN